MDRSERLVGVPQGLKPKDFWSVFGTAEVMP